MENETHPTISLNHNWINAHNLVHVYNTLASDVDPAREAIDDVRTLFQTRTKREAGQSWETEFETCVAEMVKQNNGWEQVEPASHRSELTLTVCLLSWSTFWGMVRHALSRLDVAEHSAGSKQDGEWPRCAVPASSRPPTAFVLDQVRPILGRFREREAAEWRWSEGLAETLEGVDAELSRLGAAG